MSYKLVQVTKELSSNSATCNINRIFLYFVVILGCLILIPIMIKFVMLNIKMISEPFKLFKESDKDFICSKKCCATQWPTAVEIEDNQINSNDIGKKFLTSNIQCNDGVTSTGCICVPNV